MLFTPFGRYRARRHDPPCSQRYGCYPNLNFPSSHACIQIHAHKLRVPPTTSTHPCDAKFRVDATSACQPRPLIGKSTPLPGSAGVCRASGASALAGRLHQGGESSRAGRSSGAHRPPPGLSRRRAYRPRPGRGGHGSMAATFAVTSRWRASHLRGSAGRLRPARPSASPSPTCPPPGPCSGRKSGRTARA
jgi:hypothetical protein